MPFRENSTGCALVLISTTNGQCCDTRLQHSLPGAESKPKSKLIHPLQHRSSASKGGSPFSEAEEHRTADNAKALKLSHLRAQKHVCTRFGGTFAGRGRVIWTSLCQETCDVDSQSPKMECLCRTGQRKREALGLTFEKATILDVHSSATLKRKGSLIATYMT